MKIKISDVELSKNLLLMRQSLAKELSAFGFSILRLSFNPNSYPPDENFKKAREIFGLIKNIEKEISRRLGSIYRLRDYDIGSYDQFIKKETSAALKAIDHFLKSENRNE